MIPPVASRFVAGETAPEALQHARERNREGIGVILNLLGEHYRDRARADAAAAAYRRLVDDIAGSGARAASSGRTVAARANGGSAVGDAGGGDAGNGRARAADTGTGTGSGLDACVSVKPSQVGLDVDEATFRENLRSIVERAAARDGFVWIDMEGSDATDATLDAAVELGCELPHTVGVCLQANLKRTPADLDRLADVPGRVRLVKGAYDEPAAIAHVDRAAVDEAYRDLLRTAFRDREAGVAVGSHDPEMIRLARDLHAAYGTGYEVQMLMGVREDAQRDLASEGVDVYQYAPYGTRWLSYFARRVRERRENLTFALRAVVGG